MTATPIPRTLMLATYSDLDSSLLLNKPSGRKKIQTNAVSLERLAEVFDSAQRAINEGEKFYWVCPLIEESDSKHLAAVQDRYEILQQRIPDLVGLLHGKMKNEEKTKVINQFIKGEIKIIVATTVIEVGVHVEDATIMIIEHAERFGLAQLHQLRGRVGRGNKQGKCLFVNGHGKWSHLGHPNWSHFG